MKPNILLITDDQHRFDYFGRTGVVPALRTPNWDRLAGESVSFGRSYSNCPVCMPNRYTWLYGRYASQASAGLLQNAHDWPSNQTSIAHLLQDAGYTTALVGKIHSKAGLFFHDICANEDETRARGFDHVVEVSGKGLSNWFDCRWTEHLAAKGLLDAYRKRFIDMSSHFNYGESVPIELEAEDTMDGFIGQRAREYLAQVPTEQPFFCHVSFCGPHFPLDPPAKYWDQYKDAPMPAPEGVDDPELIALWEERRRAYCALIHQIDDEIGSLLAILDERRLTDDTLVIYTCDHGDMLGWRERQHKGEPYEFSARTPLTLRWPGRIPAARVVDNPVESVDVPATIIDAAGITSEIRDMIPESPGRSFLHQAMGIAAPTRDWAYSEHGTEGHAWRMCYCDGWKYIHRADGQHELYNLQADPLEADNRINDAEQTARIAEFRGRIVESMMSALPGNTKPVPEVIQNPREARQ